MRNTVLRLISEIKQASPEALKVDTAIRDHDDDISTEGPVPVDDLMMLEGSIERKRVRALKEDGCNTNVLSRESFKDNSESFHVVKTDVKVQRSENKTVNSVRSYSRSDDSY